MRQLIGNGWNFRKLLLSSLIVVGMPTVGMAQDIADKIWFGGPILTMNEAGDSVAAVAVKNGIIVAVGSSEDMIDHKDENTEMIDLDGKTMLPGFVDAHGHVFMIGVQALSANIQANPDGEVNDVATMQRVLSQWAKDYPKRVEQFGMFLGFGYDDAQLAELRHPNRDEMDAITTELPAIIIHQSGHLGVMNSKALEMVGYTSETKDPAGGVIRRRKGSNEPDGVVEEAAFFNALTKLASGVDAAAGPVIFKAGTDLIASFGYTTAQEGRTDPNTVALMKATAALDDMNINIDVVAYIDFMVDRDKVVNEATATYLNRFRIGGYKLTIDGSPQGFTALRDRPYYAPPDQYREDYAGYSAITADQTFEAVDFAFANDRQIIVHANGEGAMDIHIAALRAATAKYGMADRRPVLIHGQFAREDQIDAYQQLGVFPSLFPMHTFYWGDWHRDRTVGPVKAEDISPTGWVVKRGMKFSSHHDAPVAFPDSMRILDATVTRRSRSGDIIGPEHRVDVMTALRAMTIWPAYQHFEEDQKGSIEPGKLADFVVLSDNPLAVDPETLDQLLVVKTVKEGETIFERK
jgi:predicted amidohydrolase YtcJ